MELKKLTLNNFKNIGQAALEFSPAVNCFLGNNGMGKSNLLDAIYVLSFCRSFSGVPDSMLIKRGETFAMARGEYVRANTPETLSLGMTEGKRKRLKRGDKEYSRLSNHIGLFPLVMTAPQDMTLITGTGEDRRRWMDMVISQSDPTYLDALIRYNHALEQRNRLLRDGITDPMLYEAVEAGMVCAADMLHDTRRRWVARLGDLFADRYAAIAGDSETPGLQYVSSMDGGSGSLQQSLDENRRRDELVKHTTTGPHRDDINMTLRDMPMKRTGSQGQCKTYTIALRLAQYEFLSQSSGLRPMLLLDDIFDKLDASRVERIMEVITGSKFGQIFITDTNRKHLDEIIDRQNSTAGYRMWTVDNGVFTPLSMDWKS